MKIRIFQDLEATSCKATGLIVRLSAQSIEKKGTFVLALSGGVTPRRLYELPATEKYRHLCDWKNIHIFRVDERFVVPVNDTHLTHPRITLSLPLLNRAENIVFLVSGKRKASIVRKIVRKEDPSLPASMINPAHENIYVFPGRDAASLLTG